VADAHGALQSIRYHCSGWGVTTSSRPRQVGCPFRVFGPLKYDPYCLDRPAVSLAIPSTVRFSLNGVRLGTVQLPVESSLRAWPPVSSLAQSYLADRPQSVSSSHGLLVPTAHEGSKVHWPRVLPARYVPPSGFGYPLDGFLPSVPCRFFFAPAALMGFTLRSVPPSKGTRGVTTRMSPLAVPPVGIPAAVAVGRPNRPRLLGFDPFESPWSRTRG
jgi:hypothetical protein